MNKVYYSSEDICEMLGISKAKSYEIIRCLNNELRKKGYIVIQGKVPQAYFNEKWYGLTNCAQ